MGIDACLTGTPEGTHACNRSKTRHRHFRHHEPLVL